MFSFLYFTDEVKHPKTRWACEHVSWCLTSLFSTNTAISEKTKTRWWTIQWLVSRMHDQASTTIDSIPNIASMVTMFSTVWIRLKNWPHLFKKRYTKVAAPSVPVTMPMDDRLSGIMAFIATPYVQRMLIRPHLWTYANVSGETSWVELPNSKLHKFGRPPGRELTR